MCVAMRLLLVAVILKGVICQYIHHPYGAFSYYSHNNFHPTIDYSYTAPAGQTVNVKLATSALVDPAKSQISATPQYNVPQYVFESATTPSPLPLNTEIQTETQKQFPSFQTTQAQLAMFGEKLVTRRPVGPPRAETLFSAATGLEQIASNRQIQAYNDYVKQLASENTVGSTTESQSSTRSARGFDDLDLESYFKIDFGEKFKYT